MKDKSRTKDVKVKTPVKLDFPVPYIHPEDFKQPKKV